MALNVPLLRESFDLVVAHEPALAARFYEVLFAQNPSARALFGRTPPAMQQQMLTEALVAVVDHLDDAPWLAETLGALGRRHVDYGATPALYDAVGAALLTTLADIAGPNWNDTLHDAWSEAYGAIVASMLAGVSSAAA